MYTKHFLALGKNNADTAGGKGASLGEMTQAGIPVPDGFVVLSETFQIFLAQAGLVDTIDALLATASTSDTTSIDKAAEKIQALIIQSEITEKISESIVEEFKKLNTQYVAVRSSATAEDGAEHAWAGQLSSYLNVTEGELLQFVKECWASLFTPRAISYRFEKALQDEHISVAVVVQKMVDAEKSGVAFSVHPITENSNQIIIEAGYGLGEAIVSGEITPDSYIVAKNEETVLEVVVQEQVKGLFRCKTKGIEGNSEWVTLSKAQACSQVLSEQEIVALSKIIKKIESHYGFPCDIEWAYQDGNFFITQSRPITTLGNTEGTGDSVVWEKVWEAGNAPIFEMTHGTVLAYEYQKQIGLVDADMSVVGNREKISAYYTLDSLQEAGRAGKQYYHKNHERFFTQVYRLLAEVDTYVQNNYTGDDLLEDFLETSQLLRKTFAYFNCTNPQFTAELERITLHEISLVVSKDAEEVFRDLCVSEKMSRLHLEQIAWKKIVLASQEVDDSEIEYRLKNHYNTYCHLVGDEGNAAVTLESLRTQLNVDLNNQANHQSELHELQEYSKKMEMNKQALLERYRFADEVVRWTRILSEIGHVRLELRSAWTALFYVLRTQLAQLAHLYQIPLETLEDYTVDEIISYLKEQKMPTKRPYTFSVLVCQGECKVLVGEEAYTKDDFVTLKPMVKGDALLAGSVAFPGLVEAPVVVIEWGASDFAKKIATFPDGAVLVAGQTRPMLVPVIKRAAAIVTDEGGITSHAAIVAREFKKPCVIGTKLATEVLKDGDIVTVDAHKGTVHLNTNISN